MKRTGMVCYGGWQRPDGNIVGRCARRAPLASSYLWMSDSPRALLLFAVEGSFS